MLPCSICSTPFPYARACDQAHPSVCHWCYQANMAGNPLDHRAHDAPREAPALTPRAQAAVRAYQRHVQAVCGTGPLMDLVTEED